MFKDKITMEEKDYRWVNNHNHMIIILIKDVEIILAE